MTEGSPTSTPAPAPAPAPAVGVLPKLGNLALLGLFPLVWTAPLLSTEILWVFSSSPISIWNGVQDLYETDLFLAVVVVLFAMIMPYAKTLLLVFAQFSEGETARRLLPVLEVMGRLSMTDVFLIAIYVLAYKGVGLGTVKIEWGLYAFTALVLLSIAIGYATHRSLTRPARLAARTAARMEG